MIEKVLGYAGAYKKYTLLALLLILAAVVCGIIPYFLIYSLLDMFLRRAKISASVAVTRIILMAAALFANNILYNLGLRVSHYGAYHTLENVRRRSQQKLEQLPMGIIEDLGAGTIRKLFTDDIEALELPLAHGIPEGIANIAVPLIVYISIFIADWRLGLMALVSLPIGLLFMGMMYKEGFAKMDAYYASGKKMNSTILEFVNGMEVIKIFNREGDSYRKYEEDINHYRDYTLDWYKSCWPWMALYSSVLPCAAMLILPLGSYLVYTGAVSLSDWILALCLSFAVGGPLMRFMSLGGVLPQINFKLEQIEKLLTANPLKQGEKAFNGENYDICYDHVSFAYEETEVLHDISFRIPAGSMTALVGASGSGKSTLAKLLVHYYDVGSGKITIGNTPLTEISLESLNEQISFVSQDQFLFNTSLLENIRMGKPNASDEEVLEAARRAECMEFIKQLPDGINSLAGDSGKMLSGGERQRISLARAILKNAPIIVLDEATAFVDPENEEKMNAAIAEVVEGKTLIVIAHRLRDIQNADQILVMKEGRIGAMGTHDKLLASSDDYRVFWDISTRSGEWTLGGAK